MTNFDMALNMQKLTPLDKSTMTLRTQADQTKILTDVEVRTPSINPRSHSKWTFFCKNVKITLVFYVKIEHAMRCNKFGTDDKSTHRMPTKKKFADVYEREREFSKPWKNAMTSLKTFESLDTCTEETQKSVWSQISTASGIRKNLTRET